jgi:hypothetical protein
MTRLSRTRAGLVGLLAVGAMAACTGERPASDESSPPSLAPAEQRLQFTWAEAVDVPAGARAAVDMAREWQYAYHLWDTDASVIPPFLEEHTGPDILEPIRSISTNPNPSSGPVKVVLVGVEITEPEGVLDVCYDLRGRVLVDENGRPRSDAGGITGHQLDLVHASDGDWIVENNAWSRETQDRCDALLADQPPPQPTGGPP